MSNCLLDLNIKYDSTAWAEDIDYLRAKVSVNRSAHGSIINEVNSRYYEGAKTLVDLLDYSHLSGCIESLMNLSLRIDPEPSENIPMSELDALVYARTNETIKDLGEENLQLAGLVKLNFVFTNAGIKSTNGAYIITVTAPGLDSSKKITIGTVSAFEHLGNFVRGTRFFEDSGDKCYPAGPTLRYSENFPTPSTFAVQMRRAINTVITESCKVPLTDFVVSGDAIGTIEGG